MIQIPQIFPELDVNTKLNVSIIFSFATAILTYMSIFGLAGGFGDIVGAYLGILFGKGAGILPLVFVFIGGMLFRLQKNIDLAKDLNTRMIWGVGIAFSAFSGILNIIFQVSNPSEMNEGGGLVGYIIYPLILDFFDIPGAIVILFCMLLMSFFLISQMTMPQFVDSLGKTLKNPGNFWELVPDIFEIWKKRGINASLQQGSTQQKDGGAVSQYSDDTINTVAFEPKTKVAKDFQGDVEVHKKVRFKATASKDGVIDLQVDDGNVSSHWHFPSLDILKASSSKAHAGDVEYNKSVIKDTLTHFGITVEMKDVRTGPTVSQYSLKPANGVKLSAIDNVQRDLGLALATSHIRIEAPINGQSLVGIEIPNTSKAEVRLKEILTTRDFQSKNYDLAVAIGQDVAGNNVVASLTKMPHLLVAGATGSGKSVWINGMLLSLLYKYTPAQLQIVLVDMKRVELKLYDGVPHLLSPVITEAEKAIHALKWTVIEMDKRYKILEESGKRNIKDYNVYAKQSGKDELPYIVFVIDELGDLMMLAKSEVEPIIVRLTQMSRAIGIHLVLGTQRPDTHVVTGLIKANIPSRISFAVASQIDSRVILDQGGAEKLLGQGDGLFLHPGSIAPVRFQGPFVDEKEVSQRVSFLKNEGDNHNYTNFNYDVTEPPKVKIHVPGMSQSSSGDSSDDVLEEARKHVITHQKASASFLQQIMGIGYPKAARVIQQLEDLGVVGPQNGSKPREVYITEDEIF